MLHLITFGGLALQSEDAGPAPRVRSLRLAVLACIAAAGERGITRERLASTLWPESDESRARQSLRQALYELRHELGVDVVLTGAALSLDPTAISSDVAEFHSALAANDRARAVALMRGPFLDGFYLSGAAVFERWVEEERARLKTAHVQALLSLANDAQTAGDRDANVEWWRRLTAIDPLSGRFALGFLKALAARGDRADALAFARAHENIVRRDLEADPDPGVRALEAELRAMPSPSVMRVMSASAHAPVAFASADHLHEPSDGSVIDTEGFVGAHAASAGAIASARRPIAQRVRYIASAAILLVAIVTMSWRLGWFDRTAARESMPTFAVGLIRDDGVPDSLRIGGVLTDMLATNLARVEGLPVLANSRLFDVMRPGQDTLADGYSDAARRAGASELVEGRLLVGTPWGLALEIRRVDLETGLLKGAFRVTAADRYTLIDSATAALARGLKLPTPRTSVADATTASPIAYRLYEEGLRAYYQYDHPAARRLMEAALAEDSTFAMAAYYASLSGADARQDGFRRQALRLAARAPDRERLTITASILNSVLDPAAAAVAESLTTRYPDDPRALAALGHARANRGDWASAVDAYHRAAAIDSAAEPMGKETCYVCDDLSNIAQVYQWWDSLPAVERIAQRFARLRPANAAPWSLLAYTAARSGRDSQAVAAYYRHRELSLVGSMPAIDARFDLVFERFDEVEKDVRQLWASANPEDVEYARWLVTIALRNQGRLAEARRLARTGLLPGLPAPATRLVREEVNESAIALSMGDPRIMATVHERALNLVRVDTLPRFPSLKARQLAWYGALLGTALAAMNDTASVQRLADSVQHWGERSAYGRDRKLHHFLRGLVHAAAGRDDDAIREYRAAIHSWTLGYTRVNYELARVLMRRGRPREAVAALQPALRGEIDGANLWITRTELHELLAQAFDQAGQRDSASVHFRAVERAWERADPALHARREAVRSWLSGERKRADVNATPIARPHGRIPAHLKGSATASIPANGSASDEA